MRTDGNGQAAPDPPPVAPRTDREAAAEAERSGGARTLICFDLGNVIIRICRSWEEACGIANVPYRPEMEALSWHERLLDIEEQWQRGEIESEEYFRAVSRRLNGIYLPDEIRKVHDVWLLGEYDGAAALVDSLNRERNVTTACLSNTNQRHWRQMEDPENGARFPAFQALGLRLASQRLGMVKPQPEIYLESERLSGFHGAEIIFFDDREDNVEAARLRGWRAYSVDDRRPVPQIRAALAREGFRFPAASGSGRVGP